MAWQRGILERAQQHGSVLTFDLSDQRRAASGLQRLWTDLSERLHDWYSAQALTVTIGFGLPAFEKCGRMRSRPKALKLMPGWPGDAFDPKQTQADMVVQVCSNERSVNYQVERTVMRYLSPGFRLKDYHLGFGLPESRGVLGFVDGTGNPKGDDRIPVVIIGEEDRRYAGGSYLVLRKIREDLSRWEKLTVDQQERVIGRRKADSAPFNPPERTPATSHKTKSSYEDASGEVDILRRSFPFGGPQEGGLVFICFCRDLKQYELIKGQMASPYTQNRRVGRDAIEQFYTAVSGGYYFMPPQPEGNGYAGDFLFTGR